VVAPAPTGRGLSVRLVRVRKDKVALLRYLLEAHEGLGAMYSNGSEAVSLITPESQLGALDTLIADLTAEGIVEPL
jgi:Domain of unknown function (DUF4911)